jgi:hypothetical protein
VIACTDREAVFSYFAHELGLHWSDDFRGVLYVPERFEGQRANPSHVEVAVAYDCFVGRACCMHTVIANPRAVSRAMVREAFAFPFNACGCNVVIGLVDSTNEAALRLDKHLGFREVHRIPDGGRDADLIVLQMLRSDCRWLRHTLH